MLKLKRGTDEYEVVGSISFSPDENEGLYQTNYTIVIDEVTTTIEIGEGITTDWEVIDVPDIIIEPEPASEPTFVPVQTQADLDRIAWLEQWAVYKKAKNAMQELSDAGFTPTEEEAARFEALKTWVGTNRKPEYSQYI